MRGWIAEIGRNAIALLALALGGFCIWNIDESQKVSILFAPLGWACFGVWLWLMLRGGQIPVLRAADDRRVAPVLESPTD
jgi:hypothetical protein